MAESELVMQGVELMLTGMGTVFVFLTLLVFTTAAMSRLVALLPEQEEAPPPSAPGAAPKSPDESGSAMIAAISAAIHRHRSRKRK